jgi:hypothetical protein
MSRAL